MALERPPKYLVLNPDGVKSYRPPESKVSTWHNVSGSGKESWLTLQEKYGIPAERIIQFNFPGAVENGKIVPKRPDWARNPAMGAPMEVIGNIAREVIRIAGPIIACPLARWQSA